MVCSIVTQRAGANHEERPRLDPDLVRGRIGQDQGRPRWCATVAALRLGAMTTTPPEAPTDGPRVTRDEVRDLARLRRSLTDRRVAGVAGGLGRHLDVDPLILRVAFVVLTFFGGAGLILYGAC